MAPNGKPTLIYFDITGRAESIRLAFHIGGIDFEDKRITHEEFAKMKGDFPFGHVPVLEIDGDYTSQSMALLLYAGMKAKMVPEDPIKRMKVLEFVHGMEDLVNKITPTMKEPDAAKKKEARKHLASETVPFFLGRLELLAAKNGKGGCCVGDTMTIADVICYNIMGWFKSGFLDDIPKDIGDKHKKLNEVHDAVLKHPKVKQWKEMPHGKGGAANAQ
eukprot:GHVS01094133.1.p1 GENE.GHVS01094133.1~~GHVS01094133.1.p1  ORF type:complete len:218 (+),score=36.32 GHVS01094133.1:167-820(+)